MDTSNKYEGIPFLAFRSKNQDYSNARGIRVALFSEEHEDSDYRGILLAGAYVGVKNGDLEGMAISLVGTKVDRSLKGVNIGGLINLTGKLTGATVALAYNRASCNGRLALQIGGVNKIINYDSNGTTIQLGLYNRSGNQIIPLVNIRGIKNMFKRKKTGATQ